MALLKQQSRFSLQLGFSRVQVRVASKYLYHEEDTELLAAGDQLPKKRKGTPWAVVHVAWPFDLFHQRGYEYTLRWHQHIAEQVGLHMDWPLDRRPDREWICVMYTQGEGKPITFEFPYMLDPVFEGTWITINRSA